MALDTDTEVTEIREVLDAAGNSEPPANASEQQKTNDRLGNQPGLEAFWYATSSTTAEALTAKTVPEGVTVLITYDPANAGTVYVGDDTAQTVTLASKADVFTCKVEDTSAVYVRTPTSGDRVGVTFER